MSATLTSIFRWLSKCLMNPNLPIFPLRQVVVLPGSAVSVSVGGPAWAALIEEIEAKKLTRLAVWTQLDQLDAPAAGTVAVEIEVIASKRGKDKDSFEVLARGVARR